MKNGRSGDKPAAPWLVTLVYVVLAGGIVIGGKRLWLYVGEDLADAAWIELIAESLVVGGSAVFLYLAWGRLWRELERSRSELSLTHANLKAVFRASPLAIAIMDRDGAVRAWNPAAERMFEWTQAETRGHPLPCVPENHWGEFHKIRQRVAQGHTFAGLELRWHKKHGIPVEVSLSAAPIQDDDGNTTGILAIISDITERKRQEERVYHMATHDALTELPNDRAFGQRLERLIERAGKRETTGAAFILDLDNFKLVNDQHGHAEGDHYLRELARHLRQKLPEKAILARFGGDRFSTLAESTDRDEAAQLAERLRASVETFFLERNGRRFHSTASVGAALIDGQLDTESSMNLAESALTEAKDSGKNRAVTMTPTDREASSIQRVSRWAHTVKEALDANRFVLHYQPIISLKTNKPAFHEALVRMEDAEGRLVSPGQFMSAAERFGLMYRLDQWVVSAAISNLERSPGLRLFVNLSGSSLVEDTLLEGIEQQIQAQQIASKRLVFEITETAAVRDFEKAERWMKRLKGLGVRFALDDFGSGFASFACLRSLPVDFVKIEGSFVRSVESDAPSKQWVAAMTSVSQMLGKRVVTEHVETEETAAIVRELGAEFAQGHLWQPAGPAPPRGRQPKVAEGG